MRNLFLKVGSVEMNNLVRAEMVFILVEFRVGARTSSGSTSTVKYGVSTVKDASHDTVKIKWVTHSWTAIILQR